MKDNLGIRNVGGLRHEMRDFIFIPVPANTVPITTPPEVVRRQRKSSQVSAEDERSTRRVSYLKATSNDQMNVDTDSEQAAVVQKR